MASVDSLPIRAVTTSTCSVAAAIAKRAGAIVLVTTGQTNSEPAVMLEESVVNHVIVDDEFGQQCGQKVQPSRSGQDLELVSSTTLTGSRSCLSKVAYTVWSASLVVVLSFQTSTLSPCYRSSEFLQPMLREFPTSKTFRCIILCTKSKRAP